MNKQRIAGFTIVELVLMMVVVGILTTIAVARFPSSGQMDLPTATDLVRATLRYGQKIAVAQNRDVYVRLNGSSVALCFDSACSSKVPAPAGSNSGRSATKTACADSAWACEGWPSTIVVTASPTTAMFVFDPKGVPFATTDLTSGSPTNYDKNTPSFTTLTLTFNAGGNTMTAIVEGTTGYVH